VTVIGTGRLEETTLGDLVARIHRARATGTLVLECHERIHRLRFRRGYLRAIELEGVWMPLGQRLRRLGKIDEGALKRSLEAVATGIELQGEALVREGAISYPELRAALEDQARERLEILGKLTRGRYQFDADDGGTPGFLVDPLRFIRGFPRRRGAKAAAPRHAAPRPPSRPLRTDPWYLLGVGKGARPDEIRRAYRRLAFELHPDRHADATEVERRGLAARLALVTDAYKKLAPR